MNGTSLKEVLAVVADIMGCDISELSIDSTHMTVAAWDSLRHVEVIELLSETFEVDFGEQDVVRCVTIRGILDVLEEKTD
jgi:acyl carrier protein